MATAPKKQRLKLSLETMAETFRADPSTANARRYRDLALEHWEDEAISNEALLAILHEIRNS